VTSFSQSNSNCVGSGIQSQGGGFKCFKSGEPGHRSSDCRKIMGNRNKVLLLEEIEETEHDIELPVYDQPLNEEIGGDFEDEEGQVFMMRKTPCAKV
jgi:hypothetical protein